MYVNCGVNPRSLSYILHVSISPHPAPRILHPVILKDAGTTGQTTGQFRPEVGRRAAFMCPVVVLKDAGTTGQTTGQSDGDGDSDTTGHRQDDGTALFVAEHVTARTPGQIDVLKRDRFATLGQTQRETPGSD